jgi:hypothetical protein
MNPITNATGASDLSNSGSTQAVAAAEANLATPAKVDPAKLLEQLVAIKNSVSNPDKLKKTVEDVLFQAVFNNIQSSTAIANKQIAERRRASEELKKEETEDE